MHFVRVHGSVLKLQLSAYRLALTECYAKFGIVVKNRRQPPWSAQTGDGTIVMLLWSTLFADINRNEYSNFGELPARMTTEYRLRRTRISAALRPRGVRSAPECTADHAHDRRSRHRHYRIKRGIAGRLAGLRGMWPITGSMADRRRSSRLMAPKTPRFCPEMKTRPGFCASWPR